MKQTRVFGASAAILYISMVGEILNGNEKACFENVNIALLIVYAWYNNLYAISISKLDSQTS